MTSVLALDQGTTGSTALVISQSGEVIGRSYREFTQHFPEPGMVEHDAEEIWRVTLTVAREAVEQAGEIPAAIGITNQRETVVTWDRATGEPLYRAIVWQDRRTAGRCQELRDQLGDEYVARRTGLVWDPYFSGTKIEWLLRNVDGLRERALNADAVFGTIDSWLIFRLTSGAVFATDHTNASRTMLYGIDRLDWEDDLLDLFGVPRAALPEVKGSSEILGETDPEHLGAAIPVAGMAGDQQAALFGQGCFEAGQAKCTYGTGAFLLMNVGQKRPTGSDRGVITTVGCDPEGAPAYALEGSIFIAGAAVQWLRDGLGLVQDAAETEALAGSVESTGGVHFVPAFVGLGAPHWEANARGTIVGVTRGTGRAHLVRAALEAMAYSVKDVADAMYRVSGVPLSDLRVDGGASQNGWLMQFQADTLGAPVARPDMVETTALGAAGLAGLATGVWGSPEEFVGTRRYERFEPERRGDPAGYGEWRRAVDTALYWARYSV
ncbi:MAG: glycerol kinase GlpK [Gemmatimonadales bacterium]